MTKLPLLTQKAIAETKECKLRVSQEYSNKVLSTVTPTCRIGCNNCCKHPVYASLLEGTLIYQALVDQGLWHEVKPKIQESSRKLRQLAPEIWAISDMPCALLVKGVCSVYQARPFSCRVTYSVGDPKNCSPVRFDANFIPKLPAIEVFTLEERRIAQKYRMAMIRHPLPTAIIWGEQIGLGKLDLEECLIALTQGDPDDEVPSLRT